MKLRWSLLLPNFKKLPRKIFLSSRFSSNLFWRFPQSFSYSEAIIICTAIWATFHKYLHPPLLSRRCQTSHTSCFHRDFLGLFETLVFVHKTLPTSCATLETLYSARGVRIPLFTRASKFVLSFCIGQFALKSFSSCDWVHRATMSSVSLPNNLFRSLTRRRIDFIIRNVLRKTREQCTALVLILQFIFYPSRWICSNCFPH